jgi:hypothetical protein
MGGLQLLSALNWCMAAIYAGAVLFVGVITEDLKTTLLVLAGVSPFLAAHSYIGATIEKGAGRGLQTVFAVLSLFAFPIGTLFGLYALYFCWFGESARSFEPQPDQAPSRPRRPRRLVENDPDRTPLDSKSVDRR